VNQRKTEQTNNLGLSLQMLALLLVSSVIIVNRITGTNNGTASKI